MIDRFNFYDVYGYLVPGLTLLVLLWIPFGVSTSKLPDADFGSAVAVVALSYVVGHVIQVLSRYHWPSKTTKRGKSRYWSDILLDEDDKTFEEPVKERIFLLMEERFRLNAREEGKRDEAFQMCRAAIVAGKIATYAEQFQGMYSLMRGLAAAFCIGAAFQFGWAIKAFATQLHPGVAIVQQVVWGVLAFMVFVALLGALWDIWRLGNLAKGFAEQEKTPDSSDKLIRELTEMEKIAKAGQEGLKKLKEKKGAALGVRLVFWDLWDLHRRTNQLETQESKAKNEHNRIQSKPDEWVQELADKKKAAKAGRKWVEETRELRGKWLCVCYLLLAFACGGFGIFASAVGNPWIGVVVPLTLAISLVPLAYLCTLAHDHFALASAKAVYRYVLVLKEQKSSNASEGAD